MAIKRVPIETVADPNHSTVVLEGDANENLPKHSVLVNPQSGTVYDGRRGDKLSDLRGGEFEIPRTIWH